MYTHTCKVYNLLSLIWLCAKRIERIFESINNIAGSYIVFTISQVFMRIVETCCGGDVFMNYSIHMYSMYSIVIAFNLIISYWGGGEWSQFNYMVPTSK